MSEGLATRAIATGAQGPQGPGFRIRLMLPAPELRRRGVTLLPLPLFSTEEAETLHTGSNAARTRTVISARRRFRHDLHQIDEAAVALVQRRVDPLPGRILERAVTRGRALVLDVDDAVWLPQPDGHPLGRLHRHADKLKWLAARADRVIAGNDYLAEWLADHARHVTVVPSLVDTDRAVVRVHRDSNTIVLGWIGTPSTARFLHGIAGPLAAFAATHSELTVRLIVVGGTAPAVPGVRVTHWRWSEQREADALSAMDVGLMPLPDNAWTRGKCAYKALQYMAAGVPVVADDVGVTGAVVGDGAAGILARRAADWQEALGELARSADLRRRLGVTGRDRAETHYSIQAWAPTLARVISDAA